MKKEKREKENEGKKKRYKNIRMPEVYSLESAIMIPVPTAALSQL